MKRKKTTGKLPSLVRGELAAAETYRQALRKLVGSQAEADKDPRAAELRRIQEEHGEAIRKLREKLSSLGEEPPATSGVWGAWSKAVEGTAAAFGDAAAIKALKEGEEHGVKDYEDALTDEALDPEIKRLITAELLPQTRAHIPTLDRLIQDTGSR